MPALTVTLHLTLLNEPRHDAVQVVRLDAHRLGQVGNRDARPRAHELESLIGTSVTSPPAAGPTRSATRPPLAARCTPAASGRAGRAGRRPSGTPRSTAGAAHQSCTCGFELGSLFLELAQTLVDLFHSAVYESGHSLSYVEQLETTALRTIAGVNADLSTALEEFLQPNQ